MAMQIAARTADLRVDVVERGYVVEEEPGRLVRLRGRLDVHSVPDIRAVLHRAVDGGTGDLHADLDGTHIADATGLGVLVGAHRRAQRRGRRLVLEDVPGPVLRLLRVTKLHRVLPLSPASAAQVRMLPTRELLQNNRDVPSSMPRRAS
ncbi:anti-anti-sigma factor [Kineococcus xinjiangensis]|uniref:Anti-sigma factor antagonist n=1 Tax=Kineococcus xinjiangensis TaxID=512762 RepID=A0A2S6IWE4_9ACTN|nr:anti-anti-sigma factor [Kineococcus xinjiangensis]